MRPGSLQNLIFMHQLAREYIVGWGTLALINAGLAQAKNRSGLGWFIGSLFLGPIATFLIVALDKGSPS
jgi:hypothetical protein